MKLFQKRMSASEAVFTALAGAAKSMSVRQLKKATGRSSLSVVFGLSVLGWHGWWYTTNSLSGMSNGPFTDQALYGLSVNGQAHLRELQRQTA